MEAEPGTSPIDFARQTPDGKLIEVGKDAQFWWRVGLKSTKINGRGGLDTGTALGKR
jgi:hypothetical protein